MCFQFSPRTPGQASCAVSCRYPWAWSWGQVSGHRAGVSEVGPDGQGRWVYVPPSRPLPRACPAGASTTPACCPAPDWGNPPTERWVPEDPAEAIMQPDLNGPFPPCQGTSWGSDPQPSGDGASSKPTPIRLPYAECGEQEFKPGPKSQPEKPGDTSPSDQPQVSTCASRAGDVLPPRGQQRQEPGPVPEGSGLPTLPSVVGLAADPSPSF